MTRWSTSRKGNRRVQLTAIAIVVIATTLAALIWRHAELESVRFEQAADAGRDAMLREIARLHATLREIADAPTGVRLSMMAELAGNDAERTAILLEEQRVTLFPARVLRYVPDPPSAREPAALIDRCERLPFLPRQARSAEAASILRELESGTWTLSRSTYESYRDALEDFVPVERDVPLWEEAVQAASAASRATANQSGEVVVWVDESRPVLMLWRSGRTAAVAVAVTGKYVADRWLRAARGVDYGIQSADRRAFLPHPPGDPQAERIISFAGHDWRMITVAARGQ